MNRRSFLPVLVGGPALALEGCFLFRPRLTVGSKTTTEQQLIGEIISQHLENKLQARVRRKFGLGDTSVLHRGIQNGEVDIYAEYTGEAILNILQETPSSDAERIHERVKGEYLRIYKLEFFPPLGINNKFAMVIPAKIAKEHNLTTLSQAAESKVGWRLAATQEFLDRREGYATLMSTYHFEMFKAPVPADPSRSYKAMEDGIVNMAAGWETDGLLSTPDYVALADDKTAFVHWQPCIVARKSVIDDTAGLAETLGALSGKLSNEQMRRLCHRVEVSKESLADAAKSWIQERAL